MRWVSIVLALVALAAAYAIGFYRGQHTAELSAARTSERVAVPLVPAPSPKAVLDPLPKAFADAIAARQWGDLVQQLEDANLAGDDELYALMYARMIAVAEALGTQEAPEQGASLLQSFVDLNPFDETALFALADLYAQSQQYQLALTPVLQVLASARTAELGAQAARLRDEYIAANARLLEAEPAQQQIDFYNFLIERDPTNDQHRLNLVRAQLLADQLVDAQATLASIAGFGVAPEAVAQLRREVQLAGTSLPIERIDDALYATVLINGIMVRLLVDTGATTTVLDERALAQVAAQRSNRVARLLTAGGPVQAPVYRVEKVQFGSLELASLDVVALNSVPAATQGLLGLDLLNQVSDLGFQ